MTYKEQEEVETKQLLVLTVVISDGTRPQSLRDLLQVMPGEDGLLLVVTAMDLEE